MRLPISGWTVRLGRGAAEKADGAGQKEDKPAVAPAPPETSVPPAESAAVPAASLTTSPPAATEPSSVQTGETPAAENLASSVAPPTPPGSEAMPAPGIAPSPADQTTANEAVAAHLEPGGCFVIENYIPELQRLPPGETIHAFEVTPTHLGFEEYDVATQIAYSHHYWVVDGKLETFSAPFRYVWPSELDLMARLAGMTLRERWSGWKREPFTSESRSHISVWEKTP